MDGGETGRPVGVITETDIGQAVVDSKDLNDERIFAMMTNYPYRGKHLRCRHNMVAGYFYHLPVVGDNDRLVGIVDILDICNALLVSTAPES